MFLGLKVTGDAAICLVGLMAVVSCVIVMAYDLSLDEIYSPSYRVESGGGNGSLIVQQIIMV